MFQHEEVTIRRGSRSGLPIIVAIHSRTLGPAIGGCRVWRYPHWRDGLTDALRLSAGMTVKTAVAGLAHGGGKTVVALPEDAELDQNARTRLLHDVGELVDSYGGSYATGPDVGTSPTDMTVVGERTRHVFCRPESLGGSGDSAPHTADGVLAALGAVGAHLNGSPEAAGQRITLIGLGHVGERLARSLAAAGARLTVTDVDPSRRALAAELGASWCEPDEALTVPTDILVPAALDGAFTAATAARLRCRAIVGPANNQLAEDNVAEVLRRRGIYWVPDYLASAGGVINAVARERGGAAPEEAARQVRGIGRRVAELLATADRLGVSPHRAALLAVPARLDAASVSAA